MGIRKISKAINRVNKQIANQTDQSSLYSRGLSREGYLGGYLQALMDVIAVLRKVPVSHIMRDYWREEGE